MLSPEEISSRQFVISLRGYDRDEVNRFLDRVAQEHAALQAKLEEVQGALQGARGAGRSDAYPGRGDGEPPASAREAFKALGEETTRILVAAEESANEIRQRAADHAKGELEQARREAREQVDSARRTANKIVADAERERDGIAAEMRRLESTRDRFMQELREAVQGVQAAVRAMGTPGADELARAVGAGENGETAEDDEDFVADHEHVDPESTTELAVSQDAVDVAAVGAAVAAAPETDEEDVDGALETASQGATVDQPDETPPAAEPAAEQPVAGTEAPAEEPEAPAEQPEALAEQPAPAAEESTVVQSVEVAPAAPEEPSTAEEGPDPIRLRAVALEELRPSMLRRLKRGLQDVQNGVLDAIRRHGGDGGGVDDLLPGDDDLAGLGEVASVFLTAGYQAGTTDGAGMVGAAPEDVAGDESRAPAMSATFRAVLGHEITSSLAATLRAGLEAGEPETSLSERVGEVFRDLKGPVIESIVDEQLVRIYGYGVLDSWETLGASDTKTWVVGEEPRCPANQCRANANEGPVPLRSAFPSGEQVPPAHDACTCALAP